MIDTDTDPRALDNKRAAELVYVAQMPPVRDNIQLAYSPWFQSILGLILIE